MSCLEQMAHHVLQAVDDIHREAYFSDDVMEPVMQSLDMSEEHAIQALEYCLQQGWLDDKNINTGFYLRPGYVTACPVNLTREGEKILREVENSYLS